MTDLGLAAFLLASLPFVAAAGRGLPIAAALGLAVGTKYAGVVLALPFVAAVVVLAHCGRRACACARDALVALAVLVATGGFWYLRNIALTGNPLYPVAVPGLPLPARYGGAEMRAWDYHLPVADVGALWELLLGAGIAFASAAAIALARARRGLELPLVAALVAVFWLVVPYQESRFLFAAFGVAAVALGRTARQPPRAARLGTAGCGARRRAAAAPGAAGAAAGRRRAGGGRRAPALAAPAGTRRRPSPPPSWRRPQSSRSRSRSASATRGYRARPRGYTVGDELDGAWAWMEANVRDSRVAYTGTNLAFPLAGKRLGNRVSYVNIAGRAGRSACTTSGRAAPTAAPAVIEPAPVPRRRRCRALAGRTCAPPARRCCSWPRCIRSSGARSTPTPTASPSSAPGPTRARIVFQLRYASPAARVYTLVGP